ncbi:MAG: thioredoxin [Paludibacteraceae bacterium]|jgi:thioredoxin 1|nr:thioredoxin [Paludibacteraceae bacterium]NLK93201.1 thioredoxin [Bacteroidales bacterium]HNZ85029.1 thioredoxin [Paludibacteraceae bacterium]HOR40398.1 thioredoxin [Paludibacteraceae bacterium]HOU26636.1 thioredoxin [Paludibacteraceae bacterium]
MAKEFTESNFEELLQNNVVVVADFWAEWCGPCRMITPIVEELASAYEGKVLIGKVNVDEEGDLATKYGIRNIPTVLFFKNGQIVDKQVGAAGKNVFEDKINALL